MQTCTSQMELALTATLARFRKLPSMRPISLVGITGEGLNFHLLYFFPFSYLGIMKMCSCRIKNLYRYIRFMQKLTSKIPMMVVEGNHEIEEQAGNQTFAAYSARFAFPSEESGSSSSLYHSFDAGGIHFIMLGAYISYSKSGNIIN